MTRKTEHKSSSRLHLMPWVFLVLVVLTLLVSYLSFSHVFSTPPKVTIFPNNTYETTLHVVTDIDYAPFSYVDENGEYAGLDVELIHEIANRLHMNLDFTLMDWNDANAVIQSGEADIIMNMETDLVTPESGLIATIPTTEKQYVVYGHNTVNSVIDLFGTKVVSLHQLNALELDITYISSYQQIFEELQAGTYDYAICPIQVGNSFLEELGMHDVYPSYAVGHVYGALALPSDREALRDRLNLVLKDLKNEGFLAALDHKWVNHHYEYASVTSIIQGHPVFATILLAGLLLLVILAFFYIAAQRRNVMIQAQHNQQLQENLAIIQEARMKAYTDELTGIQNKNAYQDLAKSIQKEIDEGVIQPFAIIVCDVNDLKKVNDIQGHKAGDRLIMNACQILCDVFGSDAVYRIGGDEFVAVLRGQRYDQRQELLDQLRNMILLNVQNHGVIIACGMSAYENDPIAATVFERADKNMYHDKSNLKQGHQT